MSKSYIIQWRSLVNGRTGRGGKLFQQAEAEQLAEELNREYPEIQHEVVPADAFPPAGASASPGQEESQREAETDAASTPDNPVTAHAE